jgi:hypothetical protein
MKADDCAVQHPTVLLYYVQAVQGGFQQHNSNTAHVLTLWPVALYAAMQPHTRDHTASRAHSKAWFSREQKNTKVERTLSVIHES